MNKKDYPDNWDWLSRQVRKRNGGRCELCNAPNGQKVWRPEEEDGCTYPWYKVTHPQQVERAIKIVLTVHHINGDKMDSTERNLISLCQKCHLRLDIVKHMAKRRAGR